MENPYLLPVPAQGSAPISVARRRLEPIISEHMEGFGAALEGRTPKDPVKRVRAHQMLRVAAATAMQSREVGIAIMERMMPELALARAGGSGLATEAQNTLLANITTFTTQMIHMGLDVFPRLIANRLVSVQPFTQPSGFIFYLHRIAKENGAGGSGAGRQLATLTTFDKTYGSLASEGVQIKSVGVTLEKELVEVAYYGLMHGYSHQVNVALRTQYGLEVEGLGDMVVSDELAWEVDRVVVDDLVTFALTNPQGTVFFDPTRGGTYTGLTPSEQQAYDKTFLSKTLTGVQIDMAGSIYKTPNWYIAGLTVAKLLARTPEAAAVKGGDSDYFDQVAQRGTLILSGRTSDGAEIWLDPQLDTNTMIAGFTDNMNPFYAGYAFCPFGAASILTAAFLDPDNLLSRKSRALAFAKKGINAKQYRVIKLGVS